MLDELQQPGRGAGQVSHVGHGSLALLTRHDGVRSFDDVSDDLVNVLRVLRAEERLDPVDADLDVLLVAEELGEEVAADSVVRVCGVDHVGQHLLQPRGRLE